LNTPAADLLRAGAEIEVLEPVALRHRIAEGKRAELLALYGG